MWRSDHVTHCNCYYVSVAIIAKKYQEVGTARAYLIGIRIFETELKAHTFSFCFCYKNYWN